MSDMHGPCIKLSRDELNARGVSVPLRLVLPPSLS
jgi:hypothetical protein